MIRNPSSSDKESGIYAWNPESKTVVDVDSLTWGEKVLIKLTNLRSLVRWFDLPPPPPPPPPPPLSVPMSPRFHGTYCILEPHIKKKIETMIWIHTWADRSTDLKGQAGRPTLLTLALFTVCCWFSPLFREVFVRVLRFSPLLKNQHFRIPIRPGIRKTKNHFVDVLPPNHYLFIYLFIYSGVSRTTKLRRVLFFSPWGKESRIGPSYKGRIFSGYQNSGRCLRVVHVL